MKVNIRRVEAGVAAASTLLVAAGADLGCAAQGPDNEEYGLNEQAETPGSARLELQLAAPGMLNVQLLDSSTDEFVRVGETLKLSVPAWLLWETLYPNDPVPDDARMKKLKATIKVSFVDKTKTIGTKSLTTTTWSGSQWGLEAGTSSFKVPAKTDTLKLTVTIKDADNAASTVTLSAAQVGTVPVFGGDLPNKSVLFDNDNGKLRQRVVDHGLPAKGSTVTLGYSDWRADQIVDKTKLNLQIGTATFSGRFGVYEAPVFGALRYEVAYAVSFDGGGSFSGEKALAPNTASRLLTQGRTDYEASLAVPADAASMLIYAHVRAILHADYSKVQNVVQKWYADGQDVVLEDAYDNPNGAYTNYEFSLE